MNETTTAAPNASDSTTAAPSTNRIVIEMTEDEAREVIRCSENDYVYPPLLAHIDAGLSGEPTPRPPQFDPKTTSRYGIPGFDVLVVGQFDFPGGTSPAYHPPFAIRSLVPSRPLPPPKRPTITPRRQIPRPPFRRSLRYTGHAMSHTVCIAASCLDPTTKRLFAILCSDSRIEFEGIGSMKAGHKAVTVVPGVSLMLAGSIPKAKEMIDRHRKHLLGVDPTRVKNDAVGLLTEVLDEQNRADLGAYLSANFGITYENYKNRSPEEQQSYMYGFGQWKDSCELIVLWLGKGFVRIFTVTDRVLEMRCFAAIGIGAGVAAASLAGRNYGTSHDLQEAVYYVYEAKKASDIVPGVGEDTHLSILEFNYSAQKNVIYNLNNSELAVLQKQYEQIGKPRVFADLDKSIALNISFIPRMK